MSNIGLLGEFSPQRVSEMIFDTSQRLSDVSDRLRELRQEEKHSSEFAREREELLTEQLRLRSELRQMRQWLEPGRALEGADISAVRQSMFVRLSATREDTCEKLADRIVMRVVGDPNADPRKGVISTAHCIGQCICGMHEGDVKTVQVKGAKKVPIGIEVHGFGFDYDAVAAVAS